MTRQVQANGSDAGNAAPRVRPWWAAAALAVDAGLILLFAGLGRNSHARGATLLGLFETAWPFLIGLLLVWGWGMVWRRPVALLRSGLPVWLGTVAVGMLLRVVTGQGTALAFVLVATLTLGVFVVGWRGVTVLVLRMSRAENAEGVGHGTEKGPGGRPEPFDP